MTYSVYLPPEAEKKLNKLSASAKKRMELQLEKLADFPQVRNCIKVQGRKNAFRMRVGGYRALFKIYPDKDAIVVVDIDKRGRIYKRMK